jgi:TRAP-type transport system small permease protein
MDKVIVFLDRILSLLGKALVGVLASGVIVSVLLRYVFSISFVWSEEILTMVFVATTFFGAALGLREHEHIAITQFIDKLPARGRRIMSVVINSIIIIVSAYVFYYSLRMIQKVGKVPSPATGIIKGVYYSMVPISFLLTIFYAVIDSIGQFRPVVAPMKGYKDDDEIPMDSLDGGV